MTPDRSQRRQLALEIKRKAIELGFQKIGITGTDLTADAGQLQRWIELGRHGEMHYMTRHGPKRTKPDELVPGTLSVIVARMDYLPEPSERALQVLSRADLGYVARYALGRDYHKVLRQRLKRLAGWLREQVGEFGHRVFVDSAPVLERALARNAGLGWIGKHTILLDRKAGSWFLLGEIYTDLLLPCDQPVSEHCGSCRACIDICPTAAIVGPKELDARRCISYLTIELKGSIPEPLRRPIGNRIFGCDDCQLVCPWNRYASLTKEDDFAPRHGLDAPRLVALFHWSEREWSARTEGSALRRAGYEGWRRNIAVALGNAPSTPEVLAALNGATDDASTVVREHVAWALTEHAARRHTLDKVSDRDAQVIDEPRTTEPGRGEHN